jgi:hypothetical protein
MLGCEIEQSLAVRVIATRARYGGGPPTLLACPVNILPRLHAVYVHQSASGIEINRLQANRVG